MTKTRRCSQDEGLELRVGQSCRENDAQHVSEPEDMTHRMFKPRLRFDGLREQLPDKAERLDVRYVGLQGPAGDFHDVGARVLLQLRRDNGCGRPRRA